MRILTGVQPSGKLHLGNYFSVIRKMIQYQESSDLYCFIANLHSLTTFKSKTELEENTFDAMVTFLALGMDPQKSTFWLQSDVAEVQELTWYLSTCITVNQLSLAHSFKDKTAKGINPSAALYYYPVLMAADILLFGAEKVPVGKDQKQHLEYARNMAEKFNANYGEVFQIPEPEIDEGTALVPGTDGQKMSKSYGNTINIFDSEKMIKKSVMSIVTDSAGIDEPKDPDTNAIFQIHSLFLQDSQREELRNKYLTPGMGYGDAKKALLACVLDYFAAYRKKRDDLLANKDYVEQTMQKGKNKARATAQEMIDKVRNLLGIPSIT
ncbi:MAG: tryptophan--tRNA ligase [Spirochaetota bacterium]